METYRNTGFLVEGEKILAEFDKKKCTVIVLGSLTMPLSKKTACGQVIDSFTLGDK